MFLPGRILITSLIFFVCNSPLVSQTTEIAQRGNFNFNAPGARPLGMGGAFIGIADDATAAEANPAGLVILTRPEFSLHIRHATNSTETVDRTSLEIFTTSQSFSETVTGPSFASYVQPVKNGAVSIYYQQASNFVSRSRFNSGLGRESFNQFDSLLEHAGFSGAIRLGERFSIGASVRYSRLDLKLNNDLLLPDELCVESICFPGLIALSEEVDDTDEKLTFNAGILFNPNGKFSFGLVFKQGADFDLNADSLAIGVFQVGNDSISVTNENSPETQFSVPDSIGAGIAFRPTSQFTVGLDLVRITYSDIAATPEGFVQPDDETEIHIGIEYTFPVGVNKTPLSLRAGYFNNPDHDGNSRIDSEKNFITIGGGFLLRDNFQLDAAFAFSEDDAESIVSVVWHF